MSAEAVANAAIDAGQARSFMREEAAIAQKYMKRVPWEMVAWGIGNFAVWLSLWPLTFSGVLPLWAAFLVSTLCCTLAYLPSHDAQHQNIARKGSKLHWVNELVGHVSLIPPPSGPTAILALRPSIGPPSAARPATGPGTR